MKLIFFDTETTGYCPGQICQLSAIYVENDHLETYNNFFSVEMMNEVALGIHGLSKEKLYKLSNNTIFLEHSEEIWRFFQKAHVVIGHNVKFDVKFLQSEFKQSGYDWKPKREFCTMQYFQKSCNLKTKDGRSKPPKLMELINYFELSENDVSRKTIEIFGKKCSFHDARYDTVALYLCYQKALENGLITVT